MTHPAAFIDLADVTDPARRERRYFHAPVEVLQACSYAEVRPVLDAVHRKAQAGFWCVGYVRYEAAPALDAVLQVQRLTGSLQDGPLVWFTVFEQPTEAYAGPKSPVQQAHIEWTSAVDREACTQGISSIHNAIRAGELYQVNYTAQLHGEDRVGARGADAAWQFFEQLQAAQPGGYAVWLNSGAEQVLSVSPELFFDWDGDRILSRPMKGTAARGSTPDLDAQAAHGLQTSAKERSENVMIVDLIRNDLSRIARPHSVQVPALCAVQALPSVWQMTSDVVARTREDVGLGDVFAALFPCGSITGAPKVRAMQYIAALETEPRGIYCGAVGVVRPGGHATFNVAIRTVVCRQEGWLAGVGSGITSDAKPDAEWMEWLAKRAYLERASAPFDLLETLALEGGFLRNAPLHLQRMQAAAAHFSYPFDPDAAHGALSAIAARHASGLWRVRLLLDRYGAFHAEAFTMASTAEPVLLQLARQPIEWAQSEFVRFKTTRRAHYDALGPDADQVHRGVFDTVLYNLQGEVTECTRGNIALCIDGRWVTPALHCGLLNGVGRQLALQQGRVVEAVVTVDDLRRASSIAFINSLRGWLTATLV